ncbi:HSP20-like chaperone [Phanerochaete sordida]|uniref:HSP20-like chaperone n=1 Tax=Phanerochaete sordida TaxID=48140 RepID=A0A9P3GT81_9APHY|nr:HSP20-like chaperone [Phanerochaete sordida]
MSNFFYEPFFSLSEFDRLFDEAFNNRVGGGAPQGGQQQLQRRNGGGAEGNARALRPRMDVHEDAEKNVVTASFELPGLSKENVNIDVHNGTLTVSGESKFEQDKNENGWAVRERRFGKFSRSIPLPQGIKPEEIKASMENGVLNVTFPKTTPEQAPKKITIA